MNTTENTGHDDRAPADPSAHLERHRLPKVLLWPISRMFRTRDPRDTVDRLFASRHVNDLRLIAASVFIITVLAFLISAILATAWCIDAKHPKAVSDWVHWIAGWIALAASQGGVPAAKVLGPVLFVLGGVLAWCYQAGSARLGVVDLFACEIDTLCRTVTVTGMVETLVNRFDQICRNPAPPKSSSGGQAFSSQENYFPILDGNARDLQTLDADVVTNITAFYTFMKAVRDMFRKLADADNRDELCGSLVNLMYMLYLALESGRKATADLVEFEPTHVERTLVILLSELAAYGFLRKCYSTPGELHFERLTLRGPQYVELVRRLDGLLKFESRQLLAPDRYKGSTLSYEYTQWCGAFQLFPTVEKQFQALRKEFSLEVRLSTIRLQS
jgi:hypothetical protein